MGSFFSSLFCCGNPKPVRRKLVVLGGSGVGKSCLLLALRGEELRSEHEITILDNLLLEIHVDDQEVELEVWDTPGRESLDRLRPVSYPDTHVLLLCFALDSPSSLESVRSDWAPVIRHFLPRVPLVLVGTKADLRRLPKTTEALVPSDAIQNVARSIGAAFYRETSALTGENVRELFYEAIKITLSRWYRPKMFSFRTVEDEKTPLMS